MNPPWQTALESCLALLPPPDVARVPRRQALGRLLLQPVHADRDYPVADLSMMDGYAIGTEAADYGVEGENRPGQGPGAPLRPGTVRRIFTGAELPEGGTRVVPQELVAREGDRVRIVRRSETDFIRRRGGEARRGAVLLQPGLRLGPVEIALLASLGVAEVEVGALPRVAHLVTGDEIVGPETVDPGSRIRDSNSDLVASVLLGLGRPLADHRRVADDRAQTVAAVQALAGCCDLLLISGGASVGDHDHARPALEAAGFRFEAHGVDLRPGKPVGLARRGNQWAVALPGNPVSHLAVLHLFVVPILLRLEGFRQVQPQLIRGALREPLSAPVPRRHTFWPAVAALEEGVFQVRPLRFLSSGDLAGAVGTNALLSLPAGVPVPEAGAEVDFLLLAPPLCQG